MAKPIQSTEIIIFMLKLINRRIRSCELFKLLDAEGLVSPAEQKWAYFGLLKHPKILAELDGGKRYFTYIK